MQRSLDVYVTLVGFLDLFLAYYGLIIYVKVDRVSKQLHAKHSKDENQYSQQQCEH